MDDTPEEIAKAIAKYDGDISSRMPDARWNIRTAIMQRARLGDFSEHVLGHGWFHLRIPMGFRRRPRCTCKCCELGVAGLPNAFGWVDWRQEEGEVLHTRYTPEYLAERLATLRVHGYAGQMEQEPTVKDGNQFKTGLWKYFQIRGGAHGAADGTPRARPRGIPPEREREPARVLECDPAGRLLVDWVEVSIDPTGGSQEKTASALGIGIICGKAERAFVLEDLTPGPAGWHDALKRAKHAVARASDLTGWSSRIVVRIEHKALGEGMIQDLREAIGNGIKNAAGENVIAVVKDYEPTGKGDKEQRSEFMEPMLEAGLIYLLDGARWLTKAPDGSNDTFVDEFAAFPNGRRDDRIDYMSQCLSEHRVKRAAWVSLFSNRPA
jgi:phage terminase large subunit-like protein